MGAIYKRELQGFFYTPVGYVFIAMFMGLAGIIFYVENLAASSGDILLFFGELTFLWLLCSPVLSMRLLAEEKKQKTDQLLLTSPVSPAGVIGGKYLAAVTVLAGTTLATFLYMGVVALYGKLYAGEVFVAYLGFLLQGCAFMALDLFLSGLTRNQVSAAVAAFGANFAFWALDLLSQNVAVGWLKKVMDFLSLYGRYEPFMLGQLSYASIVYYLCFIAFFLAASVYCLDARRYRR